MAIPDYSSLELRWNCNLHWRNPTQHMSPYRTALINWVICISTYSRSYVQLYVQLHVQLNVYIRVCVPIRDYPGKKLFVHIPKCLRIKRTFTNVQKWNMGKSRILEVPRSEIG